VLHPNLVLEKEGTENEGSSRSQTFNLEDLVKKLNSDVDGGDTPNVAFAEGVLANLADEETSECPICFDIMQIPTIIPGCAHQW
jgi:DNA repair protein RAD5